MWKCCLGIAAVCLTCGVAFCEDSNRDIHYHEHNNKRGEIFEEISKYIGSKRQPNKDGVPITVGNAVKKIFSELNLATCNNTQSNASCNTCFSEKDLILWYKLSSDTIITEENLEKISTGILYILSECLQQRKKVSRHNRDVCKNIKKLAVAQQVESTDSTTSNVFESLQNKYGNVENKKIIDDKSLVSLLRDVNKTLGIIQAEEECFSARDIISNTGVPHDYIDEHDFKYVAGYIILKLLEKKCIRSEESGTGLPQAQFFVDEIFEHFGNGTHISPESFELLYKTLKLGNKVHNNDQPDREHNEHEDGEHKHRRRRSTELIQTKCYDAKEILEIYSVPERGGYFNQNTFQQISPSLIHQIETGACANQKKLKRDKSVLSQETESWKPWVGMLLSITAISLSSLSGIFAAPLSNRKWFPYFIMYLISLAVAVLIGDAMLHLFPHAVGLHQHKPGEDEHSHDGKGNPMLEADSFLWKSLCFLVGIYIFFLFEVFMHAFGGGHTHSHGMEEHVTSSSTNNSLNVKGTLGMSEDSVVYNLSGTDSKIVTRPSGLHECTENNSMSDEELETIDTITSDSLELNRAGSPSSQSMLVKKQCTIDSPLHGNNNTTRRKNPGDKPVTLKQFQSVAWMVLIGDGIHNFLDGIAIGVAFSEAWPEGLHGGISTSIAILCHELPHELGDFAVLLNSGLSIRQALMMNFISSLTAYIGGIIGVSLGTQWDSSSWIFAFTAGLFVYIALVDMLPEVLHSANLKLRPWFCIVLASVGLWTGFGIMLVLGAWEEDIKSFLK